jgi:hypothetical protein
VGKVREVGNFGKLWGTNIFRGQIGRQMYEVGGFGKFCEVRDVRKYRRSVGLVELGGRKVQQDVLAGIRGIFATSCRLFMLHFLWLPHRKVLQHYSCSNTY